MLGGIKLKRDDFFHGNAHLRARLSLILLPEVTGKIHSPLGEIVLRMVKH